MANTVQLKRSAVAGRIPTTSDLALGEVGINTYDGKVYIKKNDGADAIVQVGGPGGSDTHVLFNDGDAIGGDAGFTYNKTTDALTVVGLVTASSFIPSGNTTPSNGLFLPATNTLGFATNSSVRLRIDSSGRIFSGPTTARANFNNSTFTAALQVEGASFDTSHVAITRSSADSFSSNLTLAKTRSVSLGGTTSVVADDVLGALHFEGADGSELVRGATVSASVDGTPGANSMPTRLIFSTTPAGGSSPSERLRVRSDGNVGLASVGAVNVSFYNQKALTGGVTAFGNFTLSTIQSDVTTTATGYATQFTTQAAAFTLDSINHFSAGQTTFGAGSSVTNQYGFVANSSLTGATNNFGFYSNIASSTGRWNFYANGTAPNYFAGDIRTNTVVTQRSAPTNSNTSVTATAASLLDGLRTGTPTANINLTLPTGTNMDAAFQDLQANQSFEWSVINLAGATHVITVVQNTGHTVVGNMNVAAASSGRFLTRKTAANTFITYRIA